MSNWHIAHSSLSALLPCCFRLICSRLIGLTKQIRPGLPAHLHEVEARVAVRSVTLWAGDRIAVALPQVTARVFEVTDRQTDRQTTGWLSLLTWRSCRECVRADMIKAHALLSSLAVTQTRSGETHGNNKRGTQQAEDPSWKLSVTEVQHLAGDVLPLWSPMRAVPVTNRRWRRISTCPHCRLSCTVDHLIPVELHFGKWESGHQPSPRVEGREASAQLPKATILWEDLLDWWTCKRTVKSAHPSR